MDGVLEVIVALCGCKVLCNFSCLPLFKRSLSIVTLCCSCLLFFTDLSIFLFLAYLWYTATGPMSSNPSSDIISLRFLLFLSDTYRPVLMLTPPLVAVEVLISLLGPNENLMELTVKRGTFKETKGSQNGATETREVRSDLNKAKKKGSEVPSLVSMEVCNDLAGSEKSPTRPEVNIKTMEEKMRSQSGATKTGVVRLLQKWEKSEENGSDVNQFIAVEVLHDLPGPEETLTRLKLKSKTLEESKSGETKTGEIRSLQNGEKSEENGSDVVRLVAVEVLNDLPGPEETLTRLKLNGKTLEESESGSTKIGEIRSLQTREKGGSDFRPVGCLICLLLWVICGTCARSSWRQEQEKVSICLERGRSLSTCLPYLFTTSSPITHNLFWVFPVFFLFLLGLSIILGELISKWARTQPQREKSGAAEHRAQSQSTGASQQAHGRPERTPVNPLANVTEDHGVDSEKTDTSCTIHKPEFGNNDQQRLHGRSALQCHQAGLDSGCVVKKDNVELFTNRANGIRHCSQPQCEALCLKFDLITAVIFGLLVWVLPTVLSTNILLISSLDHLVVYTVKCMLNPSYAKD